MLQTERLYLRNLNQTDIAAMYDYRNDSRCNIYQRYEGTSREYLERFVRNYGSCVFLSKEEEQHYAIVHREKGALVGDLTIFYTEKDNCFTFGITIAPMYQRQGYAYELLKKVVAQIQGEYPGVELVALVEKENVKSIRLFQKLNFIEECYAESIGSYVFSLKD